MCAQTGLCSLCTCGVCVYVCKGCLLVYYSLGVWDTEYFIGLQLPSRLCWRAREAQGSVYLCGLCNGITSLCHRAFVYVGSEEGA